MHENIPPKNRREVRLTIENHTTSSSKVDTKDLITHNGTDLYYVITGKKYIPFFGRFDNFPFLLLQARLNSTTHNACITSIAQSTIGKGLIVLEQENPNKDLIAWSGNVNTKERTLNEALKRTADGERAYGNQFIEVRRGSINGKKFLKLKLHNIQYCRLAEPNEDDDMPEAVYVSKLFAKKGIASKDALKKARLVPLWSDNLLDQKKAWIQNDDGTESTMLHFKNEVSGIDYYGLPSSFPSYTDQQLEHRYSMFDMDNLDNNMILGGLIVFKSAMTADEARAQAQEILMTHTGEGKTGRIAVVSSENGIEDFVFTPYTTQKEGSFLESDKKAAKKIIEAHGWDSLFAGTDDTGALSKGSGYIRAIWDLKETSLLNPLRDRIIENVVIPIVKIWAEWFVNKEVLDYKFGFKSAMPYSFMGDIDPDNFLQVNEARQMAGQPIDDGKKGVYLAEVANKNKNVQSSQPAT
jgi:hypothetical protein